MVACMAATPRHEALPRTSFARLRAARPFSFSGYTPWFRPLASPSFDILRMNKKYTKITLEHLLSRYYNIFKRQILASQNDVPISRSALGGYGE
jgi:hypothetical protein